MLLGAGMFASTVFGTATRGSSEVVRGGARRHRRIARPHGRPRQLREHAPGNAIRAAEGEINSGGGVPRPAGEVRDRRRPQRREGLRHQHCAGGTSRTRTSPPCSVPAGSGQVKTMQGIAPEKQIIQIRPPATSTAHGDPADRRSLPVSAPRPRDDFQGAASSSSPRRRRPGSPTACPAGRRRRAATAAHACASRSSTSDNPYGTSMTEGDRGELPGSDRRRPARVRVVSQQKAIALETRRLRRHRPGIISTDPDPRAHRLRQGSGAVRPRLQGGHWGYAISRRRLLLHHRHGMASARRASRKRRPAPPDPTQPSVAEGVRHQPDTQPGTPTTASFKTITSS